MFNLTDKQRRQLRTGIDLAGLAAFLIGYLVTRNLVAATWWLVGGSALGLLVGFVVERRLAVMPLITGGAALIFGGLTLIFHDDRFVKMKPTFMNLAFAALLAGGVLLGRNPLKLVLGEALHLPDNIWRTLTWRYAVFFLAVAAANWFVATTQSNDTWVFFRFPGLPLLTLVFSLSQAPLLMKHMQPPPEDKTPEKAGETPET